MKPAPTPRYRAVLTALHYATAQAESVVQINGMGPFDITYVNDKDDPRNAAKVSSR